MFESRHDRSFRDRTISARYAETTCLARSYTRYLESLAASRRVEEIRLFHALEYDRKRERILALRGPNPEDTSSSKGDQSRFAHPVPASRQDHAMVRIYTYSKCDTCRRALRFLRERNVEFEEIAIRETPPSNQT